jgi:predicted GNAT superfamily acetyltransferase
MPGPFRIAPLATIDEYAECERLQQRIWESDAIDVVPRHLLLTFQRHGGVVLGAFDSAGQMIGFAFGFLGQAAPDNAWTAHTLPAWQHCSHELGVVRDWRGRGVGYALKLAQREWVMRQGLDLITWTYDPLEIGNASLNLGKLGAVCRCYLRDLYGAMADGLNVHLPSDRFEVAWRVASPRVAQRLAEGWQRPSLATLMAAGAFLANPGKVDRESVIRPTEVQQSEARQIFVEVPANFQAVKKASLDLALEWRLNSRMAFETYFAAGYSACDVVRAGTNDLPRAYYLLQAD